MTDPNQESAKRIMGWHIDQRTTLEPNYRNEADMLIMYTNDWNPLQDLKQCFQVVERMRILGFLFDLTYRTIHGELLGFWLASFYKYRKDWGKGKTPNEAILTAVLKAKGVEVKT